ncbi:unnamed protein product [Ambrosiozyma monospora]|uniref:Unnamed protein product n=1 Tax=Ambrosiozyma monospora TaxID=43982 RepID=A0A9W6T3S8_AMBMO|nr:unnamed protein product [Ambrosiozyma monospora]
MITSMLPDNWIAVSIAYSHVSKSLLFTRYSHSLDPFTLQLPLTKSMSRMLGQNNFDFNDANDELVSIIQESKKTTSVEVTSTVKTSEDRAEWWGQRRALDSRLEKLLLNIESKWFGGFKGILGNTDIAKDEIESMKLKIGNIVTKSLSTMPHFNKVSGSFDSNDIDLYIIVLMLQLSMDDPRAAENVEDLTWISYALKSNLN